MSYARTSLKGTMYYNSMKAFNGFTLFTPVEGKSVWLIDMLGRLINQWETPDQPSCDARLLPNGNLLLASNIRENTLADVEGTSGVVSEIDWDGKIVWEYRDPYLHHSVDRLKNGNNLVLKWVKTPDDIAKRVKGGDPETEKDRIMLSDVIQEVTNDGKLVWEWIAYEHLDPDVTSRCPFCPRDTWTHANAVSELPNGDILVSFMKINTIAIIDKKTGRINWQWGSGILAHQHCPTMLDNGNILVFDNGMHPNGFAYGFSRVLEVNPATNTVVWGYGGGGKNCEFYSSTLGSCQRLPNENTLICEGTTGRIFEVNPSSELVWEFANNFPSYEPYPAQTRSHMVYSAYRYAMDYTGLKEPVSKAVEKQPAPGTFVKEQAAERRLKHLGY